MNAEVMSEMLNSQLMLAEQINDLRIDIAEVLSDIGSDIDELNEILYGE
jgi:hypothetical protein